MLLDEASGAGWQTDREPGRGQPGAVIRHGNFDYLTNTVNWDPTIANHTLPNSFYLSSKPAFFGGNPWPWVNPIAGVTYTLPAKKGITPEPLSRVDQYRWCADPAGCGYRSSADRVVDRWTPAISTRRQGRLAMARH
jgi:hypothetical protein